MSKNSVVALYFEKTTVLRLIDHAEASPEHMPTFAGPAAGPALWLVGDKGIYLFSNGLPAIMANGELDRSGGGPGRRLVCYAEGCHRELDPVEAWRPIHNAIDGGNDFTITVDRLADVRDVIDHANAHVVVVTDGDAWEAFTESEFALAYERPAAGAVN
jgi:hypothetical protein